MKCAKINAPLHNKVFKWDKTNKNAYAIEIKMIANFEYIWEIKIVLKLSIMFKRNIWYYYFYTSINFVNSLAFIS